MDVLLDPADGPFSVCAWRKSGAPARRSFLRAASTGY
jgi:hypothetical protein